MAGVFDRLQQQINSQKQEKGITALDLADLSPGLRKIMRLMLREMQLNYPRLCEEMDSLPAEERLTRTDLNGALDKLTAQFWLTRVGEGERAIYKVNLKRRSGSSLPSGIWTMLDTKLKDRPK
ncbi:MAG: hypothetical protein HZB19_18665 [Chloroflexi bacterium]|nr:hypothetical protein [Chloroflexota bacterium]